MAADAIIPAITGVGSLPHRDPAAAVRFALETATDFLPLPQLPALGTAETMIEQLSLWVGRTTPGPDDGFSALMPFAEALAAHPGKRAKVQLVGPVTALACSAHSRLTEPVGERCVRLLLALASATQLPRARVVVQLDEPMLGAADAASLESLRMAVAALRHAGHPVWVHCCGTVDWDVLLSVGADGYSIDAWLTQPPTSWPSEAKLVLGAVPTDAAKSAGECAAHAVEWPHAARIPRENGADRLVISPACGLGLRTRAQAAEAMAHCHHVAAVLSTFPARPSHH